MMKVICQGWQDREKGTTDISCTETGLPTSGHCEVKKKKRKKKKGKPYVSDEVLANTRDGPKALKNDLTKRFLQRHEEE